MFIIYIYTNYYILTRSYKCRIWLKIKVSNLKISDVFILLYLITALDLKQHSPHLPVLLGTVKNAEMEFRPGPCLSGI